jgi:hypothetical protein
MIAYPPGYESKPLFPSWRCSYCGREWPDTMFQCAACGAGREARREVRVRMRMGYSLPDRPETKLTVVDRVTLAGTAIK